MPRVPFVLLIANWLVGLAGCGCAPEPPAPTPEVAPATPAPPAAFKFKDYNVVLVSFDALQAAHVGSLGNPRDVTPTIDALAAQGYSFRRAYSVASWTVPASMTWFTGVYPSVHRMTNKFAVYAPPVQKIANLRDLAPDLMTLAEVLKENGYATAGFTGNAGVSGGFGYEQGFDVYYYEQGKFGSLDRSVPKAVDWLRANKEKKFFLFLHGYDAHGQNTPAAGFDYRFVDPAYDGKYTGSEQEQETLREQGLDQGKLNLRDADIRFWNAIYDEKIQRADAHFKQFLDEVARLGLLEKTLFIVTSDHGTEFCEHGRFDHGFSLYDEQIHVPLVVKLPGQTAGRMLPDNVSSIDVMPTILDLVDAQIPARAARQMQGTSLVPTLRGEAKPRDAFSETDYRLFTFQRSIVAPDGWKLIVSLEDNTRELYNLHDDPGETRNRAADETQLADELQRRLFAHFKAIGHDLTARRWERGFNPVYALPEPAPPGK